MLGLWRHLTVGWLGENSLLATIRINVLFAAQQLKETIESLTNIR